MPDLDWLERNIVPHLVETEDGVKPMSMDETVWIACPEAGALTEGTAVAYWLNCSDGTWLSYSTRKAAVAAIYVFHLPKEAADD